MLLMILIFYSPLQSKAFFTFEFISTCEHFQIFRFLIKHSSNYVASTAPPITRGQTNLPPLPDEPIQLFQLDSMNNLMERIQSQESNEQGLLSFRENLLISLIKRRTCCEELGRGEMVRSRKNFAESGVCW